MIPTWAFRAAAAVHVAAAVAYAALRLRADMSFGPDLFTVLFLGLVVSGLATLVSASRPHPAAVALAGLPLVFILPFAFVIGINTLLALVAYGILVVGLVARDVPASAAVIGSGTFAALDLLGHAVWWLVNTTPGPPG